MEPNGDEITAALALLKTLSLDGTTITGDAVLCQSAICQPIGAGDGDYRFAVKARLL